MRHHNQALFRQVDPSILNPHAAFVYSRRQLQRVNYDDQTYKSNYKDKQECLSAIKQGFIDMRDDGFDFMHSRNVILAERLVDQDWKIINFPKMRLQFPCQSCKKNFTTSKGTIEAHLKIIPINVFNRLCHPRETIEIRRGIRYATPFIIFYDLKIYRMACSLCSKFRTGKIDQPCLRFTIDILCKTISDKLTGQRFQRPHRFLKFRKLQNHRQSLCQACQKGKCNRY